MPRCYMVKKGGHAQRHGGAPPFSPTEASVAPSCYNPEEHSAVTGPDYVELGSSPLSERSAADTEAAHELLSLAQSVPPLPPLPPLQSLPPLPPGTVYTVLPSCPTPIVPLYTYTIQPTNIYILTEPPQEPVYHSVQTVEYTSAPPVSYVSYQSFETAENTEPPIDDKEPEPELLPIVTVTAEKTCSTSTSPPPPSLKEKTKYDCNECGKRYATSSNLSRHKQTHRSIDSGCAKRCGECGKAYVSMPALAMHVLTHRMGHVCGVCGKQFSRPWLLRGHLRLHTGEKPYSCTACGKTFADRSNLRAHHQTHSADKKYHCELCDKTFVLKSYLNKHHETACTVRSNEKRASRVE